MSETTQTAPAPWRRVSRDKLAPDTWLARDVWPVAASIIFIVLIVIGLFPRLPW
jgi:hypothetical protein